MNETNQSRLKARQDNTVKQQHVQNIGSEEPQCTSIDDEYLYTCVDSKSSKMPSIKVKINNVHVKMIIDTGASITIFFLFNKYFSIKLKFAPRAMNRSSRGLTLQLQQ